MLTSSALDYLGLTKQFGREELVLYSAELSKQLPELFIHLSGEVRETPAATRLNNWRSSMPTQKYRPTCANCSQCC